MAAASNARFRELIAFDRRIVDDDTVGNPLGEWKEQFRARARVQPLKGGEHVVAGRLSGQQPVVIRVHWTEQADAVTPAWRARNVRTGKTYNITSSADMTERKRHMDFLAVSGGSDG